jgi:hypothetical protein|tara:strand:+ start:1937 stop:2191 length:255 start_codon:yes stop_codon:yes gene_type:complete
MASSPPLIVTSLVSKYTGPAKRGSDGAGNRELHRTNSRERNNRKMGEQAMFAIVAVPSFVIALWPRRLSALPTIRSNPASDCDF